MDLLPDTARSALSTMVRSRRFEECVDEFFKRKEMHGTTHLAIGQEAAQVGLSLALREGDWIVPTHRCHGHTLARGSNERKMFSELFGSRDGLSKGLGGSMHMSDVQTWNPGSSAVVGSGVGLATGLAFALKMQKSSAISVAIFGDGATSRGIVHESMNLASVWELPLLFYCENNGYGMSAAASRVIATSDIAARSQGYRIEYATVDGNDLEAVLSAAREAVQYIRTTGRPYFLEVNTYRLCGHSKNDPCLYRSREEEALWRGRDPIVRFSRRMIESGLFAEEEVAAIIRDARRTVDESAQEAIALKDDRLSAEEALALVFAPEDEQRYSVVRKTRRLSFRDAIREALDEEMSRDERVHLIGEDIGLYGGCFKVTGDLFSRHGAQLHETPVSEEGFTSLAVGSALLGLRPVVELMYGDFVTLASDAIINHASKIHYMSGGQLSCPMVLRAPMGSGTGHGSQHTQSLEAMFANVPGLIIVAPSCPGDAKALLKSAIRSNNPVLYFEHKGLYNTLGAVGDEEYLLPIGKAIVKKRGVHLTIVGYSRSVSIALEAATRLALQDEIEAEVIDLATLKPMDTKTVVQSVKKTGRLIVVHDSPAFGGYGSEVISAVSSDGLSLAALKAPPIRIGGKESPIPFSLELERTIVPTVDEVVSAARSLFGH
ncbi:MAG TPA: dehydrogenase E1 component subunit alpha/beta [Sphaerochaeta sp.]|nr:dehydrogenase E1 component subunit alpha/beta [Sphaerochaeta sp.]